MLNDPLPLQPVTPVSVQVPEMVGPFTAPCKVSTLFVPEGKAVEMIIENVPVTCPWKSPVKLKVPV